MSHIIRTDPARIQPKVHPGLSYKKDEFSKEEERTYLIEAGKLATKVRDELVSLTKPGVSVLELCKKADDLIYQAGAIPAFPINISVNDVAAHYTSQPGDSLIIPEAGVVKIDCGVSINGYIADTAKSVDLDGNYGDLIKATVEATEMAIKFLKPGTDLGHLGGVIAQVITDAGFQSVKELRGHLIQRYIVHAGKSVPNVELPRGDIAELGEVYAIEPFASTGTGHVHADTTKGHIFRAAPTRIPLRSKPARKIFSLAIHEFKGMPFSDRWLEKFGLNQSQVRIGMTELKRLGGLLEYHVLRAEGKNAMVAQTEHTMILTEDLVKVTT